MSEENKWIIRISCFSSLKYEKVKYQYRKTTTSFHQINYFWSSFNILLFAAFINYNCCHYLFLVLNVCLEFRFLEMVACCWNFLTTIINDGSLSLIALGICLKLVLENPLGIDQRCLYQPAYKSWNNIFMVATRTHFVIVTLWKL